MDAVAEPVASDPVGVTQRKKWPYVVAGVALMIAGAVVYSREFSAAATLAKALTAEGWVVIGRKSCPYTLKQIDAFGMAQTHLKFIRSDDPSNQDVVSKYGVEGVPHWQNTKSGASLRGYRKLASLQAAITKAP